MITIKSPFSSRRHVIPPYEVDLDYVVNNSATKDKLSRGVINNSVNLEKNPTLNVWSIRKNEYRDWTLHKDNISILAEKHKRKLKPKKWRNW